MLTARINVDAFHSFSFMRILGILKNCTYAVLLQKDSSALHNEKRRTSDIDRVKKGLFILYMTN